MNVYPPTEFDHHSYKRSRESYVAHATFDYFILILIGDAFIAKLLAYVGLSDSIIGIVSSCITLSSMFQLLSITVAKRMVNTKRTVIIIDVFSKLLYFFVYGFLFLPIESDLKKVLMVSSLILAHIASAAICSIKYGWANSYVSPAKRGSFSALKEMISLASGIIFTLIAGAIVDKFDSIGNVNGGFIFITMLVLSILCYVTLLLIRKERRRIR